MILSGGKRMNKVICPNCGRDHSILRKDGKIRYNIHCRCKDWSRRHTLIWWLLAGEYVVSGKNMELIPVMDA